MPLQRLLVPPVGDDDELAGLPTLQDQVLQATVLITSGSRQVLKQTLELTSSAGETVHLGDQQASNHQADTLLPVPSLLRAAIID